MFPNQADIKNTQDTRLIGDDKYTAAVLQVTEFLNQLQRIQMKLGHTGPLESPRRTSTPWCMSTGRKLSDSLGSVRSIKKHVPS